MASMPPQQNALEMSSSRLLTSSCSGNGSPLTLRRQKRSAGSMPQVPRLNKLKHLERRRRRARSNIYPTSPRQQQQQQQQQQNAIESPQSARYSQLLEERRREAELKHESIRRQCFVRYDIGGAAAHPRSSRMFEAFFVIGNCKKSGDVMQVLYEFPKPPVQSTPLEKHSGDQRANLTLAEAVKQHCGILGRRRGAQRRYEYPFFGNTDRRCTSFVFTLIRGDRVFYVACVVNEEPWDYYFTDSSTYKRQEPHEREWRQSQQKSSVYNDSIASNGDTVVVSLRYYCLVTTLPCLNTHFDLLYSVLEREKVNFQERMHYYENDDDGANTSTVTLLEKYYGKKAPASDSILSFSMRYNVRNINFYVPRGDSNELLARWCLPTLAELLSPRDITLLLGYLMQEKPVLVRGSMPLLVSQLVLSMKCMLRPFSLQHIVVLFVTDTMMEVLDSPVPVLAGIVESNVKVENYPPHFAHVVITVQKDCSAHAELLHPPEQMNESLSWALPNAKNLEKTLSKIVPHKADAAEQLMHAFKSYQMELIYTMGAHVDIGDTASYMFDSGDRGKKLTVKDNLWIDRHVKGKARAFWHTMIATDYFRLEGCRLATVFIGIRNVLKKPDAGSQEKHELSLRIVESLFFPKEKYEGDADTDTVSLSLRRSQSEQAVRSRRRSGTAYL